MKKNIQYKTKQIAKFYSAHRQKWDEFYPSERWVFDRVAGWQKVLGDILDVGCACGGLGLALSQRFVLNSYTGIDINEEAILWACDNQKMPVPTKFISGDVLKQKLNKKYDTVVSLSCADWNIETKRIIDCCWDKVRPGGNFIISLRLTEKEGINNIKKSYQYIDYSGGRGGSEVASYVVFNFKDTLRMMSELRPRPQFVGGYGYWGVPSKTAVTLFDKLFFVVFYIQKQVVILDREEQSIKTEFNLPIEIFL